MESFTAEFVARQIACELFRRRRLVFSDDAGRFLYFPGISECGGHLQQTCTLSAHQMAVRAIVG